MGINKQTLQLMLLENEYKEITGDFLCIGKQTVNVDFNIAKSLFEKYNLNKDKLNRIISEGKFDKQTRHAKQTIFDHDLISCFSNDLKYHCLDRSNYEGADIIHDMNTPLPSKYESKFDFIYNGSCMDNIFNPVLFLQNTTKMLRPGGRILHIECATSVAGAFLMFSPEWFFSYYSINNFSDVKVYVTIARENGIDAYRFNTDLYSWQPYFTRDPNYNYIEACKSIDGLMHVILVAEKGENSTSDKSPIQMQYLDNDAEDWRKNYEKYKQTSRPLLKLTDKSGAHHKIPQLTDHFTYIGSNF